MQNNSFGGEKLGGSLTDYCPFVESYTWPYQDHFVAYGHALG